MPCSCQPSRCSCAAAWTLPKPAPLNPKFTRPSVELLRQLLRDRLAAGEQRVAGVACAQERKSARGWDDRGAVGKRCAAAAGRTCARCSTLAGAPPNLREQEAQEGRRHSGAASLLTLRHDLVDGRSPPVADVQLVEGHAAGVQQPHKLLQHQAHPAGTHGEQPFTCVDACTSSRAGQEGRDGRSATPSPHTRYRLEMRRHRGRRHSRLRGAPRASAYSGQASPHLARLPSVAPPLPPLLRRPNQQKTRTQPSPSDPHLWSE